MLAEFAEFSLIAQLLQRLQSFQLIAQLLQRLQRWQSFHLSLSARTHASAHTRAKG